LDPTFAGHFHAFSGVCCGSANIVMQQCGRRSVVIEKITNATKRFRQGRLQLYLNLQNVQGRVVCGKREMLAAAALCCGGVICFVLLYKVAQFVLNCLKVKQRYKESPLPGPVSPGGLLGEYYAVAPKQLLLLQQHNEHAGQVHSSGMNTICKDIRRTKYRCAQQLQQRPCILASMSAPLAGHFCCMQAMSLCC
jgi:hypothetical protein